MSRTALIMFYASCGLVAIVLSQFIGYWAMLLALPSAAVLYAACKVVDRG